MKEEAFDTAAMPQGGRGCGQIEDPEGFFAERPAIPVPGGRDASGDGTGQDPLAQSLEIQGLLQLEQALRFLERQAVGLRETLLNMALPVTLLDAADARRDAYKERYYPFEKELFGIEVHGKGGKVHIRIPAALPHRKEMPGTLFREALCACIREYRETDPGYVEFVREAGKSPKLLLAIRHSYKTPWMVRDNDNIEVKAAIDCMVSSRLLSTDMGDRLSILSTAGCGDRDGNACEMTLIPYSLIPCPPEDLAGC